MNLITIFVLSDQHQQLLDVLQEYTGITTPRTAVLDVEQEPHVISDANMPPTSYRLFQNGSWSIIEVNSVLKLHEMARYISENLATTFLQIIYCEPVDYSYLLFYVQGKLIREIEARGQQQTPHLNLGQPFTFEDLPVEFFDLDLLAFYCQQWNIDLSNLYPTGLCTILERTPQPPMVCMDYKPAMEKLLHIKPPGHSFDY